MLIAKKQLSDPSSKFRGLPVTTTYSIAPVKMIMSAKSSFPSPMATQPLELNVELNALGLKDEYAFGAFHPAELPNASAVLFSVNLNYSKAESTMVISGKKDQSFNCVVSSVPKPFALLESSKFGADVK